MKGFEHNNSFSKKFIPNNSNYRGNLCKQSLTKLTLNFIHDQHYIGHESHKQNLYLFRKKYKMSQNKNKRNCRNKSVTNDSETFKNKDVNDDNIL